MSLEPIYILFLVSCAINGWLWAGKGLLKKQSDLLSFQLLTTGGVLANILTALHAYSSVTNDQEFTKIFGELLTKYPKNLVSGAATNYNSMKDKMYGK